MASFCLDCGHSIFHHHRAGKCFWPDCKCKTWGLTARELEIVRLLAMGKCVKDVGVELGIATKTVIIHRANAAQKMGTHSASQLVIVMLKAGLLSLAECPDLK